jgi:hypothetical protein
MEVGTKFNCHNVFNLEYSCMNTVVMLSKTVLNDEFEQRNIF